MTMLNLERLNDEQVRHTPYDYLVVSGFVSPEKLQELNHDFPNIDIPGNYAPGTYNHGPAFEALLREARSPQLAALMSKKFGVKLDARHMTITVRTFCEPGDGNIHTDHWSKRVTAVLYFNEEWSHDGGRLRVLRSADDMENYSDEVIPAGGNMIAFKRARNSYHGHRPHTGSRRIIQINWNNPSKLARLVQNLNRIATHTTKRISRWIRGERQPSTA